ncbi:ABC transporter permease [Paenibacillus sp. y28]|uniref:ABC transporter permease n=1 Tax=Paenibacillus sp. y28 TaxID=3129110 RepID=UPI00301AC877
MPYIALIQNEWMKLNSKKQTALFGLFLLGVIGISAFVVRFSMSSLADRMGYTDFAGYMVSGLGLLIPLFGIVIASQIVADEYRDGTIRQLLIRPASRAAVLWSKYATLLIVIVCAYAVLFVLSLGCGLLVFGTAAAHGGDTPLLLFKQIMYRIPGAIFEATVAFAVGAISRSVGLAISIGILLSFSSSLIAALLARYSWSKYLVFANLDLAVYDSSPELRGPGPLLPGMTFGFSLTVLLAYLVLLYIITLLFFTKRDVH